MLSLKRKENVGEFACVENLQKLKLLEESITARKKKISNGDIFVMTSVPNGYWLEVIPENRY